MVTKNLYYVVKLGPFESVFSTSDLVGYNMFWDAFSDSWMLADREDDYAGTLASLCPDADTTEDALARVKKDPCLFYRLCVAAECVYQEYCDSSVDSYIAGPFTAAVLADQLGAGELASMWAGGDLPAELESELEARGVYLSEDGDSLVIK